jgi:hypothetical protein
MVIREIILGTQVANQAIMRFSVLIFLVAAAACGQNPEESAISEASPPPAAALAGRHQSLDEGLKLLDAELAAAMSDDLGSANAKSRLLRAEAITDRLLEADLPFHWLNARDYSVESMIRQIQALADRVVAKMRNGMDGQEILVDVRDMRRKVLMLRRDLTAGGGPPPVSLDSLLARYGNDTTVVKDAGASD